MFKQMAYQKFIVIAALVLSSMAFLYALGFATDLYTLNYHSDSNSSMLYVEGAELYNQIQPFNKALLKSAAILFGLCLTLFVTLTHRRRLYYATNYITTICFSGYAVSFGAAVLQKALYVRHRYLAIDFEKMKEITDMLNMRYVKSTLMMDVGLVLSIGFFLLTAGLMMNLIWKTVNRVKEKRQMRGAEA